jgi:AraC family transcriptional regulator
MQPRIEVLKEKKLVGKRIKMSLANNQTSGLWRDFMPQRKDISNSVGSDLYSVSVYGPLYFQNFDPRTEFEKWAATEVTDSGPVPDGLEIITLPGGLYAVFVHRGPASAALETYQYIFGTWLSGSEFLLDNRPHFEIMGEKYKNEDPDSEEEVWIPLKPRSAISS